MELQLKIGELARRSQCQTETIRFYEREGLLPEPLRTPCNYRVYGSTHVERLAFIRNCRALDMTLDEIRQLLRLRDLARDNCRLAHALVDEHVAHVAERIQELQQLERQLKALRRQCRPARRELECAILDELTHRGTASKPTPRAHVRGTHRG